MLARRTDSPIRNQGQGTEPEIRYAPGYNNGPPNGGYVHGIYTDPTTGRRYILPEPPRIDGSNGPPQTSPIFAIHEYNGPTSPWGPATYLYSECGTHWWINSEVNSSSSSNSRPPSTQTAGTRITLTDQGGRVFRPLIYQPSEGNNDVNEPD